MKHEPRVHRDWQNQTVEPRCSCGWVGIKEPYWPSSNVERARIAAEMHVERMIKESQ